MNKILKEIKEYEEKVEIKITWRFIIYIIYIGITMFLVTNALFFHYEYKPFAGFVFIIYVCSYIMSIFLIRRN